MFLHSENSWLDYQRQNVVYAKEAKTIASFLGGFQKRVTISNRDFTFSQYIKLVQQFEQINRQKQYITFTYMVFVR